MAVEGFQVPATTHLLMRRASPALTLSATLSIITRPSPMYLDLRQ